MEALGNLSAGEKAQFEGTVTSTYGDGVYKTNTKNIMMDQTQIIYADSIITIMEVMGQQFAFRMTREQADKMQKSLPDSLKSDESNINLVSETKSIIGKTCNKAEIERGDDIIEIYYLKDFILTDFMRDDNMKEIVGLPMEYTMPMGEDVSIHMIATSIKKKKKVKSEEFAIPEGIKVMSFEEMQAMMGQ